MSTFHGLVEEIPGLSVDRFDEENLSSSVYFLTHFHTDHTQGLDFHFIRQLRDRGCFMYCSALTKLFIQRKHSLDESLSRVIKELEICSPTIVEYVHKDCQESLTVNTVPAGHCPGSVMFIFQTQSSCVLYTGDFRISPGDYPKLKPLNLSTNGRIEPRTFDRVYLDTTFLNPDYQNFPTREKTLEEIARLARKWLAQDGTIVSLAFPAKYGSEFLLMELSGIFGKRIHVDDRVHPEYARIDELAKCVTVNSRETRIHACGNRNRDLPCRDDVRTEKILHIFVSAMRWKNLIPERTSERDVTIKNQFYVCCSMHPSYNELLAFIDYFKPKSVYPCVEPPALSNDSAFDILDKILRSGRTQKNQPLAINLESLIGNNSQVDKAKSKYFSDDSSDEC